MEETAQYGHTLEQSAIGVDKQFSYLKRVRTEYIIDSHVSRVNTL